MVIRDWLALYILKVVMWDGLYHEACAADQCCGGFAVRHTEMLFASSIPPSLEA